MKVKIIYDYYENEYVCFVEKVSYAGYGKTEKESVIDFLKKCYGKEGFNTVAIDLFLNKLQDET